VSRILSAEFTGIPLGGRPLDAVVIGASTGGPGVIQSILDALPRDFPAPIAICQHMPTGFTRLWAERLNDQCRLKVIEASNGDPFVKGGVHIAPAGFHIRFKKVDRHFEIVLDCDFADSLFVPSIDIMMSSAAQVFGSGGLAALLTGLGSDGALGMLAMRRAGAHTIVEAPETAVASSMPASAVELGAAVEEASKSELGALINRRVRGLV